MIIKKVYDPSIFLSKKFMTQYIWDPPSEENNSSLNELLVILEQEILQSCH